MSRHAAGWIAEIAIPWTSLTAAGVTAAPKPGDQWRAGLYRIKRPGGPAKAEQIAKLAADADKATGAEKQTIEAAMEKLRASDEDLGLVRHAPRTWIPRPGALWLRAVHGTGDGAAKKETP